VTPVRAEKIASAISVRPRLTGSVTPRRRAGPVKSTVEGAARLGAPAVGLRPWESIVVPGTHGRSIRVTATPARHGPATGDRGPVIGFLLDDPAVDAPAIYISGDTVWYDGTAEVARRARVGVAEVDAAFAAEGLAERLRWLAPGIATVPTPPVDIGEGGM
jgi:hypothetical protein